MPEFRGRFGFAPGGGFSSRPIGGGGIAPAAQPNPWEATTPGVYLYAVPRDTAYFVAVTLGAGAAGRAGGQGVTPAGNGGAGAGCATGKFSKQWVDTEKVYTVTVGEGGTTLDGATSKLEWGSSTMQSGTGGTGDATPGTGFVSASASASQVSVATGNAGGAHGAPTGGGGGKAGGGLFVSVGGVGGGADEPGKDGAFGGGGGGGGHCVETSKSLGGHGGNGAVRITAYRTNGGLV